jgi:hypothetical protein
LSPIQADISRRSELAEALAVRIPFVRIIQNPEGNQAPANTLWVEASVPAPLTAEQMPRWLVPPVFQSIAAAVDLMLMTFEWVSLIGGSELVNVPWFRLAEGHGPSVAPKG